MNPACFSSSAPRISIVVINWNGRRFLRELMKSIVQQTKEICEVLMVDNGSEDGSCEWLKKNYSWVTIIEFPENKGFSKGCNDGITHTKGDWVLILNSDVTLLPSFLEEAVKMMDVDEGIGSIGGKILRFDYKTIDSCGQILRKNRRVYEVGYGEKDLGQFNKISEIFSVCPAVALYRRKMLEDISLNGEYFDEDFFSFFEDMDLGWRAQNQGWKAYYTPHAIAYHFRGGTNHPKTKNKLFFARFEFVRRPRFLQVHIILNRYLMIIKNDSFWHFLKDLPSIVLFEILLWGYLVLFRPILVLDVLKNLPLFKKAWMKRRLIQYKNKTILRLEQKPLP